MTDVSTTCAEAIDSEDWLWRWLPHRLSKLQSLTTVLKVERVKRNCYISFVTQLSFPPSKSHIYIFLVCRCLVFVELWFKQSLDIFKQGWYCETGLTVYSLYPWRSESLTICGCNCEGSTFSSVILRPWVMVRLELNSWPLAWQPVAQPLSHRCAVFFTLLVLSSKIRLEKILNDSKLAYNGGVMKKMVSRNPLILLGDWSTEISMYKAGPELFIFL